MSHDQLVSLRWNTERAAKYMEQFGVIKGVNFVPSYCFSYIEIWHHFNEIVIRRELGYAKACGFNSLRIFVAECQWETSKELVLSNMNRFLDITREMGFSIMLTLQPNTYMIPGWSLSENEDPFITCLQPGGHDKGWTYKGARIFDCKGLWEENRTEVERFIKEILTEFGKDERVSFWDLYNEPWEANRLLVERAFELGREINPVQPLTCCWRAFDISDIITFHCYEKPGTRPRQQLAGVHYLPFEDELARAKSFNRPILCTECVARTFGNEIEAFLPYYRQAKVGFYVWGLCAGSAQYHIPWDWPVGSPVPQRWFQCMLYPDGTPFDASEIDLIKAYDFDTEPEESEPVSGLF